MNCVIYARYSSEKQNEKSIEDQIKECTKFAEDNGFTIIGKYVDRAKSGKSDRRPDFLKMIRDSANGGFKYVLCWKYDRISRNTRDYYYYEKILVDNGVNIISINEIVEDPQAAPIIKAVNLGMAESFNVTLAINVNRGMRSNAEKCKSNGSLPYGYISDKQGNISLDPDKATFIKEAFEMFDAGAGLTEIAEMFNSNGLKTKFNNDWNGDAIRRLLKNDRYMGVYRFSDIVKENGVPAVVDKDIFIRVQDKLKTYRKKMDTENRKSFILNGKLRCSKCNKIMAISAGTSKNGNVYRYYKCGCRSVRKDEIEPLVIDLTKEYILTDEVIEKIADYAMDLQAEVQSNSKEQALKNQLKEVQKKIDNIWNAVLDGFHSDELNDRLNDLEKEKKTLQTQIDIEEAFNEEITRDSVIYYFKQFQDSMTPELEKELIDKLIMYVYLDDDEIWIQYKFAEKEKDTQVLRLKELECSNCHHLVNLMRVHLNTLDHYIILHAFIK